MAVATHVATAILFLASAGLIVNSAWSAPHASTEARIFAAATAFGVAAIFFVSGMLLRSNIENRQWFRSVVAAAVMLVTGAVCVYNATGALNASAAYAAQLEELRVQERAKLADRIKRNRAELDKLPAAPPGIVEKQARISVLRATPRANGCVVINGPVSHEACVEAARLEAEALADIRSLDTKKQNLAKPLREDEDALSRIPPPPGPDTRVTAVMAAAKTLGMQPTYAGVEQAWRLLLALLIECGPALLAMAAPATRENARNSNASPNTPANRASSAPANTSERVPPNAFANTQGNTPANAPANALSGLSNKSVRSQPPPSPREANASASSPAAERLLQELEQRGGQIEWGQRALAQVLGVAPSTTNKLLASLERQGKITCETGKKSTKITLVRPPEPEPSEPGDATA